GAWLVRQRGRFDVVVALGAKTTALPGLVADLLGGLPLVVLSLSASEFAEPISAASLGRCPDGFTASRWGWTRTASGRRRARRSGRPCAPGSACPPGPRCWPSWAGCRG